MLKNFIALVLSVFILSSCATGPSGYFKRSANNKLFDMKGFKGGKRSPLYNKKYVAKAKKNILYENYEDYEDDEEDDEVENSYKENIEIYKAMIAHDMEESKKNKKRKRGRKNRSSYPSLHEAKQRSDFDTQMQNMELKEELEQIKSMLKETKHDLTNYRCPMADDLERKANQRNNQNYNSPVNKKETNKNMETEIIDPTLSI